MSVNVYEYTEYICDICKKVATTSGVWPDNPFKNIPKGWVSFRVEGRVELFEHGAPKWVGHAFLCSGECAKTWIDDNVPYWKGFVEDKLMMIND